MLSNTVHTSYYLIEVLETSVLRLYSVSFPQVYPTNILLRYVCIKRTDNELETFIGFSKTKPSVVIITKLFDNLSSFDVLRVLRKLS